MRAATDISSDPSDYPFRHPVRVRFAETDAMGVLHHAAYAPLLEEARVEHLRSLGHPYTEVRAAGHDLPVLELVVQYRRPARFDDVVDVHTRWRGLRGASLQVDYLLTVEQTTVALAATVHAVVDREGRPVRTPAWVRELFASP